jgi:hypothetical protein
MKICVRKAVLFYGRKKTAFHLCVHPETVRHYESTEDVVEACVRRHEAQQSKHCFFLYRFLTGGSEFAHAPALNKNFNNALNATQTNTRCVRDIWQRLELCNRHLLPAGNS